MGASLDQPLVIKLVEHSHQRNRLEVEPRRDFGLAYSLVAGNVEHHRSLPPRDRQSGLSRLAVETPLNQARHIVYEEAEISTKPCWRPRVIDHGLRQRISLSEHRADLTRRHGDPPPGPSPADPTELPAHAMAGMAGRPSGQSAQGKGK